MLVSAWFETTTPRFSQSEMRTTTAEEIIRASARRLRCSCARLAWRFFRLLLLWLLLLLLLLRLSGVSLLLVDEDVR